MHNAVPVLFPPRPDLPSLIGGAREVAGVFDLRMQQASLCQGVTTVVLGQDGLSFVHWGPARRFALTDRGLVRPGFAADLVVLDPLTIADRASYAAPVNRRSGWTPCW
jgi:N-acyl-D-aspartate/D-glutamate deacylase